MNVALLFGSFNPLHKGHIAIATHLLDSHLADEVWLVISPQNPLKERLQCSGEERATTAERKLKEENSSKAIKISRIELEMESPSYSYKTVEKLLHQHPEHNFILTMGEDNLRGFYRWRNHLDIAQSIEVIVYPREGNDYADIEIKELDLSIFKKITILKDAPLLNISSTMIRKAEEHIALGYKYQKEGTMDKALNEFIKALELDPENKEAKAAVEMLKQIFEYSYMESYNL